MTLLVAGAIVIAVRPLVAAAAGVEVLQPYQTERVTGFLDPTHDPSGPTWNVNQSITAIGSGGFDGRGVVEASQTRLDYLPEHATDFAFASLGEQRGFVGCSVLLLLYLLVVWRGLRVVTVAGDLYSAVVAGGLVFAFLFQVFVNAGMTMGVAPVTGIPLPFIAVGGTLDGREPRAHRRAAGDPRARQLPGAGAVKRVGAVLGRGAEHRRRAARRDRACSASAPCS